MIAESTPVAAARTLAVAGIATALVPLLAALGPRAAHASGSTDLLAAEGLVTAEAARGAELFFRGTFGGNGRTCGTCHPVEHNLTIDPDFIATLPASDPLFVGDDPGGSVPGLERRDLLRDFALILENLDDPEFEDPTHDFVMRSVPHVLSLATSTDPASSPPEPEPTGWSGDGSPDGTLSGFSTGAVRQHFTQSLQRVEGVDFRLPTPQELADLEAFMRSLGRLNKPNLNTGLTLPPNSAPARGHDLFFAPAPAKCRFCHRLAGADSILGGNGNFNTGVEQFNVPPFGPGHPQTVDPFPLDGGHGLAPFDTDGDGVADSFGDGTFNVPPLIEAADTPPFFHDNRAQILEGAVNFYNSADFNSSAGGAFVGGIAITQQQVSDIAAFLRVINAAFNIEIAVQRAEAAAGLSRKPPPGPFPCAFDPVTGQTICPPEPPPDTAPTVLALLALSSLEAADAFEVLDARDLNPVGRGALLEALDLLQQAVDATHPFIRKQRALEAVAKLNQAEADLGSGFGFVLGEGNLLF